MEVSKQFPNLKEQLLYKLGDIALHEEKRLEESASFLASQVILSPEHVLQFPISCTHTNKKDTFALQASSINSLAEEVLAAASHLPLETLLLTRWIL